MDQTIRIWDLATFKSVDLKTNTQGSAGHSAGVSCLQLVSAEDGSIEPFVASGGGDNLLIVWKASDASYMHHVDCGAVITALETFQSLGQRYDTT
jgi:WD40 repeat protein